MIPRFCISETCYEWVRRGVFVRMWIYVYSDDTEERVIQRTKINEL